MAIEERKFQPATHQQLETCLKWCLNTLQLRNFQVDFNTGTKDPNDLTCGWTIMDLKDAFHEKAEMWVDIEHCKLRNVNPYVAVCHEALHVLMLGKCLIGIEDIETPRDEYANYALQDLLYEKFCRDNKIKMVEFNRD